MSSLHVHETLARLKDAEEACKCDKKSLDMLQKSFADSLHYEDNVEDVPGMDKLPLDAVFQT